MIQLFSSPISLDEVGELCTYGKDEVDKRKPSLRVVYRLASVKQSVVLMQFLFDRHWKDGKGALDGPGITLEQKRCSMFLWKVKRVPVVSEFDVFIVEMIVCWRYLLKRKCGDGRR